MSDYFNNYY